MNEASIIINGVRYDAVEANEFEECITCDLRELCQREDNPIARFCITLTIQNFNFKQSNKIFEK